MLGNEEPYRGLRHHQKSLIFTFKKELVSNTLLTALWKQYVHEAVQLPYHTSFYRKLLYMGKELIQG